MVVFSENYYAIMSFFLFSTNSFLYSICAIVVDRCLRDGFTRVDFVMFCISDAGGTRSQAGWGAATNQPEVLSDPEYWPPLPWPTHSAFKARPAAAQAVAVLISHNIKEWTPRKDPTGVTMPPVKPKRITPDNFHCRLHNLYENVRTERLNNIHINRKKGESIQKFEWTYMAVVIELIVGEFEAIEGHELLRPLSSFCGRIRMDMHPGGHMRICTACHHPRGTAIRMVMNYLANTWILFHKFRLIRHYLSGIWLLIRFVSFL